MASFYTEQQSLDVREGLARRVKNGLFVSKPPFGYINKRIDGRSLIEVDSANAVKVCRIYDLYAYEGHTIDSLAKALASEGVTYCESMSEFYSSRLYSILTDRSYIGEVKHNGHWHPGSHKPLVDRATWDRVQVLLGQSIYRSHQMRYAGELIHCAHCGSPITGETKTKKTKKGDKQYVYYRCTRYHLGDHPRIRMTETEIDEQLLALFDQMRVEDEDFRNTFREELRKATNWDERSSATKAKQLQDELIQVRDHQNRLLNLRLLEEIEADTFAEKAQELRDREANIKLQIDVADRSRHETIDLAIKAFELSQNLRAKWFAADVSAKRRILEIICLNWTLDGVTLVPEMRKPFDQVAEGLQKKDSRGDRRWAFPNDMTGSGLLWRAIAQTRQFSADEFYALGTKA